MTRTWEHVDFERLNAYVDGVLDEREAKAVEEHLAVCQTCALEHDQLKMVLRDVGTLSRSVLPPEDLWPELKKALNSRKEISLTPKVGSRTAAAVPSWKASPWIPRVRLLAAGLVLVVLSSWVTATVLRSRDLATRDRVIPVPSPSSPRQTMLLASFRETESEYTRTIEELKLAVDTQRSTLSPETVRTIDHSLAVVDSAIAEARAALLADPNSQMLMDLLSSSYQRKLDLLRRSSELASRI
jgi:putative zinc finger protein